MRKRNKDNKKVNVNEDNDNQSNQAKPTKELNHNMIFVKLLKLRGSKKIKINNNAI
jgi:hypothetical protein